MTLKRVVLILGLLAVASPVHAQVDPKVVEQCKEARDFLGCVQVMTGGDPAPKTDQNNQKAKLIKEIKKIPSRISNTSLRDYTSRTLDFEDEFALSTPESVGPKLYNSAEKISGALNALYQVWDLDVKIKAGSLSGIKPSELIRLKNRFEEVIAPGVNLLGVSCQNMWFGLLGGGSKTMGLSPLPQLASLVADMARQAAETEEITYTNSFSRLPLFSGKFVGFCPNDPWGPVQPKKEKKRSDTDKPKSGRDR